MIDKETIDMAVNHKFTDFEAGVKSALQDKLAGHSDIVNYTNEFDTIRANKAKFADINGNSEE